jgi:hypothetical protein
LAKHGDTSQGKHDSRSVRTLRLRHVTFEHVEFDLIDEQGDLVRPVVVRVVSGTSWANAVKFPTIGLDATETTGDAVLDAEARRRAAEELVRLEGAVDAARADRGGA